MKNTIIILLVLLLTEGLQSQERRKIKKEKHCLIVRQWVTQEPQNQLVYYNTRLYVPADTLFPYYRLVIAKYKTTRENHPLNGRIFAIAMTPDSSEAGKNVSFFTCTLGRGRTETVEQHGNLLYAYDNYKRLLIIEQKSDSTFVPKMLAKEGRMDDLYEYYYCAKKSEGKVTDKKNTVKRK